MTDAGNLSINSLSNIPIRSVDELCLYMPTVEANFPLSSNSEKKSALVCESTR